MNQRIVVFLLFVILGLANASGLRSQPVEKPLLLIGVSEGSGNAADPRPAQSAIFRTRRAGFQVIQGTAGYVVFVDVIKRPDRRQYTKAVLQNPRDPFSPFVYEHFIDPDTPGTTLMHGPVKGLVLHQEYKVELILYEDEARTKETDRLTQLVRSYVDTAGPKLKISDQVELGPPSKAADTQKHPEVWTFNFDSRPWKLGHQAANAEETIREYVLQGETVEAWSELVTSHSLARVVEPKAVVETMKALQSKDCPSFRSAILEESAASVLYEWQHKGCRGFPSQHEIRRIARSSRGTLFLAYVAKTEQLSAEQRRSWISILKNAAPVAE